MEELHPPRQLSSDPEAGSGSRARGEVAGSGIVEAEATVDDLADKSAVDGADPDILDAGAMLDGVGRYLGGGEEHLERLGFAESGGDQLRRQALSDVLGIGFGRDRAEIGELLGKRRHATQ